MDVNPSGQALVAALSLSDSIRALLPGVAAEREFPWLGKGLFPILNRDGDLIVFDDESESAGANYSVAMRRTDASPAVRLGDGRLVGLSPDAQWAIGVIYKPPKLFAYPTGAGQPITFDSSSIEAYTQPPVEASWLPDRRRFIACGNEPGHSSRCYVHDIGGGPPKPLTPEGTNNALLSPDGNWIAAVFADGTVKTWPLDGGSPQVVPGLNSRADTPISWSADGKALLTQPNNADRLERVDIETGGRKLIRNIGGPSDHAGLVRLRVTSVREDGRYYAYNYRKILKTLYLVSGIR
jgi:hypothetical protein